MLNILKIKKLMSEKKMSMYKLAKLCDVPESRILRILNGVHINPKIDVVISIAKALDVKIDEIIL